jgi:hypothetical protein
MKPLRIALALSLVLALAGCSSLMNIFSAPKEDVSAVKAAVQKQQQAVDLALALHQKSMKQMYDEGLARSLAEVNQAQQVEMDKLILAQVAQPLPPVDADKAAKIIAMGDKLRADAKAAWDKALAAGDEPQAWKDLAAVNAVLSKYILTRMGADEQKDDLATDVHDLIYKKK